MNKKLESFTRELNNGMKMPGMGLGTWKSTGKKAYNAVTWALDAGYRLIDTAAFYRNEKQVGKAIRDSDIEREDIFVTTKLWNSDQGREKARKAFEKSFTKLDIGYIDLYLVHWPIPGKRHESWETLMNLLETDNLKAIGVSNYTIDHLKELLDKSDIKPVVNQVEFHPFLYQEELLEFCKSENIQLEAYSPLARANRFDNSVLKEVADNQEKTVPQVMIRWSIQKGIIPIPKSVHEKYIRENRNVFDFSLSEDQMDKIDNIGDQKRFLTDPHQYE